MASISRDPRIHEKSIVFDDPFSSQDQSRRVRTQQVINRIAMQAQQVIVLSHDATFLRDVWESAVTGDKKAVQLVRMGERTVVKEWPIEDDVQSSFHKLSGVLTHYLNEGVGEKEHVAKSIRPYVEQWLCLTFPSEVGNKEMLGPVLGRIRNADPTSPLAAAQAKVEDLEDINNYSCPFMHSEGSNIQSRPIDDNELQSFVERALDVCQ